MPQVLAEAGLFSSESGFMVGLLTLFPISFSPGSIVSGSA